MSTLPQTFGKYELIERIATGGMAEVYRACMVGQAGFTKQVVIKRLHPDLNADESLVTMLIDEARLTARLQHANVCQVLDLDQVDGVHFLAMEFVDGVDLLQLVERSRRLGEPLPLEAAVHITAEILEGLVHAHGMVGVDGVALGIVHRDISLQNVLVSYEGEVKIIDFGVARARERQTQTQAGVVKGKLRYMSPEQAAGRTVDHRSDVFSTGVVLHELLAGESYARNVDDEVVLQMRRAGFGLENVAQTRPEVPVELDSLLQRATAADPDQRFDGAAAFRDALTGFARQRRSTFGRADLARLMKRLFERADDAPHTDSGPDAGATAVDPASTLEPTVTAPPPRAPEQAAPALEAVATTEEDMGAILAQHGLGAQVSFSVVADGSVPAAPRPPASAAAPDEGEDEELDTAVDPLAAVTASPAAASSAPGLSTDPDMAPHIDEGGGGPFQDAATDVLDEHALQQMYGAPGPPRAPAGPRDEQPEPAPGDAASTDPERDD